MLLIFWSKKRWSPVARREHFLLFKLRLLDHLAAATKETPSWLGVDYLDLVIYTMYKQTFCSEKKPILIDDKDKQAPLTLLIWWLGGVFLKIFLLNVYREFVCLIAECLDWLILPNLYYKKSHQISRNANSPIEWIKNIWKWNKNEIK